MKTILIIIFSLFLFHFSITGQYLIKGQIIDSNNAPLIGVNILLKDSSIGTITDANGFFELTSEIENPILNCSYIGYKSQNFQTQNKLNRIILEESAVVLDEVEVVGFQTAVGQARRRVASSQQIPESINTFTTDHIVRSGITTLEDFAS